MYNTCTCIRIVEMVEHVSRPLPSWWFAENFVLALKAEGRALCQKKIREAGLASSESANINSSVGLALVTPYNKLTSSPPHTHSSLRYRHRLHTSPASASFLSSIVSIVSEGWLFFHRPPSAIEIVWRQESVVVEVRPWKGYGWWWYLCGGLPARTAAL